MKNGENWLQNHLWCPNDTRGKGIDDDNDDDDDDETHVLRLFCVKRTGEHAAERTRVPVSW